MDADDEILDEPLAERSFRDSDPKWAHSPTWWALVVTAVIGVLLIGLLFWDFVNPVVDTRTGAALSRTLDVKPIPSK